MDQQSQLTDLFTRLQRQLTKEGLPAEWYIIENYSGYSPVTGNSTDTVYCLEANVGPYPYNSDYTTYAIVQVFWDKHPNLSITSLMTLNQAGEPVAEGLYSKEIDERFSLVFLPTIYRAFNTLDPQQGLRSQVVQRYTNNRVLLQDFIPASLFTLRLLLAARFTGQYATIAGDFDDRLTKIIASFITPFVRNKAIHLVKAVQEPSSILVPTRNRQHPHAPPHTLSSSSAIDQCFQAAQQYIADSCK